MKLLASLFACVIAIPFSSAQVAAPYPTVSKLEFEAVSIHMVDSNSSKDVSRGDGLLSMSSFPTNVFVVKNAPLAFLVQIAYDVDDQNHISAMPGWMESQEYSISAKIDGDQQLMLEQMRPMLRRLLEQRFHFVAHSEPKVISGFALVIAKGGPKLKPGKEDGKPFAQILPDRIDGMHMKTTQIAGVLAHRAGQPIVDHTGLSGIYDFSVNFAPRDAQESLLPDFFSALQEQLGLRLQPDKVPVEYLVIDHVDKVPTDN